MCATQGHTEALPGEFQLYNSLLFHFDANQMNLCIILFRLRSPFSRYCFDCCCYRSVQGVRFCIVHIIQRQLNGNNGENDKERNEVKRRNETEKKECGKEEYTAMHEK